MKKTLLTILLVLALCAQPFLLASCSSETENTPTGATEQTDPTQEPTTAVHVHNYEYALIHYGDGFALEGRCTALNCTKPTVITDEGVVPEYQSVAPTCTHAGSGTWTYQKDGVEYTLTVKLTAVESNHAYENGKCIHCNAKQPTDQPEQPEHVHAWKDASCTMPMICSTCGEISGNAAGHTFADGSCSICGAADPDYVADHIHSDSNNDDQCDICYVSVAVVIDFYVVNDLHGKFCDSDTQPGVDNLASYLKERRKQDDNVIVFSSGDMWQGAAESNLTNGKIITEWMNAMDFVSMTLGNHEYDWGEDAIRENLAIAEFPFLAINIYDKTTGKLADYCTPSVMVECNGLQVGIIGAIGDCYSSISSDMVTNVEFKVGSALTALVKAESEKLRAQGADLIVYSLHDGYGNSNSSSSAVSAGKLSSYYDASLSNGYVDLVFEGHTHQSYVLYDNYGVYHLQGGGENKGITHVEISVNSANGSKKVTGAEVVKNYLYSQYAEDPDTEAIEDKYTVVIDEAYDLVGYVSNKLSSKNINNLVAELYLRAGMERWGDQYDIVLGGGFLKTRSPYDLAAGEVTYSDILSLLPFDNQLVLCSISGKDLNRAFINTSNSNYHNVYSDYGNSVKNKISSNKTYYVVVDSYTAFYAPNKLTVVDYYDEDVYARDLVAEEIASGRFDTRNGAYAAAAADSGKILDIYYVTKPIRLDGFCVLIGNVGSNPTVHTKRHPSDGWVSFMAEKEGFVCIFILLK